MDTEEPLLAISDVSAPVVTAMDTGDPSLLALHGVRHPCATV
jgi:hypothetical protein